MLYALRIHFWLVVDRHKLTVFYLKSFDMDSVQVGKAVFGKEIHTTLGIEPRTNSNQIIKTFLTLTSNQCLSLSCNNFKYSLRESPKERQKEGK